MKLKDYEKVLNIMEGNLLIGKSYGNNIEYAEEASVIGTFEVIGVDDYWHFIEKKEAIKNIAEFIETYNFMVGEEKSFDEYQKDLVKPISPEDIIIFLDERKQQFGLPLSVFLELFSKGYVTDIEKSYLDKRNTKTPIVSFDIAVEDGNYSIVPVSVNNEEIKEEFTDDCFEIREDVLNHAERRKEADKHKEAYLKLAKRKKKKQEVDKKKYYNKHAE